MPFQINFRIFLFMSAKTVVGVLAGIVLNLHIHIRRAAVFTVVNHVISEEKTSALYVQTHGRILSVSCSFTAAEGKCYIHSHFFYSRVNVMLS